MRGYFPEEMHCDRFFCRQLADEILFSRQLADDQMIFFGRGFWGGAFLYIYIYIYLYAV